MTDGLQPPRRDPAAVEARVRRRRRWVLYRMLRGLVILASLIVAVGVVGAMALSRTQAGRNLVLEQALEYLRPRINGVIEVGALGPAGLLGGARIYDIRVSDSAGRPILTIDSLQVRYSLLELVGNSPAVSDLSLWRPELVLERTAAGTVNAVEALRAGPVAVDTTLVQDSAAIGLPFRIRGATIHEGGVRSKISSEVTRIEGINVELGRVDIRPDGESTAALRALSFRMPLGTEEIDVREMRGALMLGNETLTADLPLIRLAGSEGGGRAFIEWGADGWRTTNEVQFDGLDLADVRWLDRRVPPGSAQGEARITVDPGGLLVNSSGISVELDEGGTIAFQGGIVRRGGIAFQGVELRPSGVPLSALDPWLTEEVGVDGRLTGLLRLAGPTNALAISGDVGLSRWDGGILARAVGAGTYRGPGAVSGVDVVLEPLDYGLLRRLGPDLSGVDGQGALAVKADGVLRSGMAVELEGRHTLPGLPTSVVSLQGSLFGDTSVSVVDLAGDVDPLSLTAISRMFPDLRMAGEVSGRVSVAGPMDRLQLGVDLETQAGPLDAVATFDARDPGRSYDVEGSIEDFRLSEIFPELPDSTVVTGSLALRGSGLDPETVQARLDMRAWGSRVGPIEVDTVDASVWVDEGGRLNVERILAVAGGATVRGEGGRLGIAPGSSGEGIVLDVSAPSIEGFRPLVIEGSVIARDTLNDLDRMALELEGVQIDTLPLEDEIRFRGQLGGTVRLEGALDGLTVRSDVQFDSAAWGTTGARRVDASLTARGINLLARDETGSTGMVLEGTISTDSMLAAGRPVQAASLTGSYSADGNGRAHLTVSQAPQEIYEAQGVFQLGDGSGRVNLDRLTLRFPDRRWNLRGPAIVEWDAESVLVRDFGLIRPGGDGLRIAADGRLSRGSEPSDFQMQVTDLDLGALGRLLRLETPASGVASLDLEVSGPGTAPEWETEFLAEGVKYGILDIVQVSGDGRYDDLTAVGQVEFSDGDHVTLSARGSVPADLRLHDVEHRFPDRDLNLDIQADSFPLSTLLSVLNNVEDVGGTVSGNVQVGGRFSDFEPAGELTARDGSMVLTSLGIRLDRMNMSMDLQPDGRVEVEGRGRSVGTVDVRGTLDLSELRNPVFDLVFRARELQVVDRRDVEAAVSGDSITLEGPFNAPAVRGDLEVIGGTVFIEEFQRASEVVSFYDPFFSQALQDARGDPGALDDELDRVRNPFLSSLRVLIGMEVGRGNWLRSRDMNVETSGALDLTFDRSAGQLILQGDMDVVRGTYSRLPRTFNMTEGRFRFLGTPGFNPDMTVTAVNRLQTREGQPLTITATISGTLLSPQLALASDAEAAMSEADLVSYLLLGQPASALVNDASTASVGAGLNLGVGYVANQIGYLLAPELPIDYLSVSQSERAQASTALASGAVQVEAGVYVSDEVFLAGLFQRGACADPTSVTNSWGLRVEMQVPRDVTLEGFLEDRCTREGFRGLGDLSFQLAKVWGFSLFREWGY
ncbi:MAG: translocation/assembly module TamB [Gemmatimonadetes bacterium]|nr:translocation/assembly module TamB [Gemmatimonadota bacterium]